MLALRLRRGGFVFVYCDGVPLGAILVGQMNADQSWVSLAFSGNRQDFEILRPEVVARRFGERELERLVDRFGLRPLQPK